MTTDPDTPIETDVLVIGAGGAGMYAALSAAKAGAEVVLTDRNMIGRGGATVMAQMTVAAALSEQEPDEWTFHLADTLAAGRGLCDEALARLVCAQAPERMREMDTWGVGWARTSAGIRQVHAPGHDRQRCCYVDFLNTGPAVAGTLRKRVGKINSIRRISDLQVIDLNLDAGRVVGATALSMADGVMTTIAARATVIATGGLTSLFARTSASLNMGGDGFALALRAGAELTDMEFVQFFPIGHLAPRMVGMDPIMWDPFRYKLGGRLLNGRMEEFIHKYGGEDEGSYKATRDLATYAIVSEVAAGRGTPNGGAYLSFAHLDEAQLRAAFGPVIDRLADNGIDLTNAPVEVSPIAHYHMGGIHVDTQMQSSVEGLFAAGEAVGGASGANRLSGNAISEALVFGDLAGRHAAEYALKQTHNKSGADGPEASRRCAPGQFEDSNAHSDQSPESINPVKMLRQLKELMWENVGPFRSEQQLADAQQWLQQAAKTLAHSVPPIPLPYANTTASWYDLRNAIVVAQSVTTAALQRRESRGAHQRIDFPETEDDFTDNQILTLNSGQVTTRFKRADGQDNR